MLWGQKELTDYRFSFDFKLEAGDMISFAAFIQEMKTRFLIEGKAAFLSTWITFDEEGGLCKCCSKSTDTPHGSAGIGSNGGSRFRNITIEF